MLSLVITFLQQLTSEQLAALAIVVLVITQGTRIVWITLLKRPKPTPSQTRLFVFVVSFPLGAIFAAEALPVYGGDPMQFAREVFAFGSVILIYAGLSYDYVLDGLLGFLDSFVLRRDGKRAVLAP